MTMKVYKISNRISYNKTNYNKNRNKKENSFDNDFEIMLDQEYEKLGENDDSIRRSNRPTYKCTTKQTSK